MFIKICFAKKIPLEKTAIISFYKMGRSMSYMKKSVIRLSFFLILVLALAVGLTYVSLNDVSKIKNKEVTKVMDVALVNEDEGTTFNEDYLNFGDRFVKSVDKNEDQDWYIVSRGVAENGLDRGTYDMMLIIPNDFSDKALSMTSDSPDQVVLDYKINASENDKVQAEAEKTASSILNDFNRRIIDVYFASVIGNLHDAQDNISELVEEEEKHTNTYNTYINNPLSNYTDQFERVRDSSAASKDTFQSFEDMLGSFGDSLTDKVELTEKYSSNIDETASLLDATGELRTGFMEELSNYNASFSSGNVDEQLKQLQAANDYINYQFKEHEDEGLSSIALDTRLLKSRLNKALKEVEIAYYALEKAIENGVIDEKVEKELTDIVHNAFDGEDDLSELLLTRNEKILERINKQIKQLPTMHVDKIEDSALSSSTKNEIKNVIKVTEAYNQDEQFDTVYIDERDILTDDVNALIKHLKTKGITMQDTVKLPENKKASQEFHLFNVPEEFAIEYVTLSLPGQHDKKIQGKEATETIELPSNKKGNFTVELKLRLKDDFDGNLKDLDIYNHNIKWAWNLKQTDITNEREGDLDSQVSFHYPQSQLVASINTEDQNTDTVSNDNEETKEKDDSDEIDQDIKSQDDSESEESQEDSETETEDSDDSEASDSETDQDEDEEHEIEEVEIIHNEITHQVTKPVVDESTINLINAVENTIKPYQKLLSSYESYFGFDLACSEEKCKKFDIGDNKLTDLSTDDSLYHLFNKTNIKELLADYIIDKINDDVTEKINEPIMALTNEIDEYREFIKETDANAEELVNKIDETKIESRKLNDSLEETLKHITDWREQSTNLIDSQTEVQSEGDSVQTAVMSLGQEFEPLLSQSQLLADQASSNLESADNVYSTFDRVDEQAESIQQSGTDLIDQAEKLSLDMTNKILEDQEYAENFAGVLDNSRIGGQPNEDLYDFLSSPVDTENKGLMIKGDTFTPYFLVLIGFIVSLFTAYVISTMSKRNVTEGQFEAERSLMGSNALITGITACIGVLEGLVIGLLSAHYLDISKGSLIIWTGLIILVMLSMLFVSAYLLRQLKMVGMFILLAVMSMYLFLTKALGSGFSEGGSLRAYSPLQYLENMLAKAISGQTDYQFILFSVIAIVIVGALANLLVIHKQLGNIAEDDEGAAKTES